MISRRNAVLGVVIVVLIFAIYRSSELLPEAALISKCSISREEISNQIPLSTFGEEKLPAASKSSKNSHLTPQLQEYFDQVFSPATPAEYDFPAIKQLCDKTTWPEDEVFIQCGGMSAGLTSIMSQVKVCIKMALEAGTGIIVPAMPLRDSTNLKNFNFYNETAYLTYDQWFDIGHFNDQMARICPKMKILHPLQVDSEEHPLKQRWHMKFNAQSAPGYREFKGYFWTGKPFKAWFDKQFANLQELSFNAPDRDETKKGMTIINIDAMFHLFRVTDDPTQRDLKLWNEISYLIRFREGPRTVIDKLMRQIKRPYYGVHFRVEKDTIWSSFENQLAVDLDALDQAWEKYGKPDAKKPLVYLACGDQEQVERFVAAGKERGWEVTHKWKLAKGNKDIVKQIDAMAFDFQGAVDMGIMLKSHFFLGITGSAFSHTIGNARDGTGRYRGSSFAMEDGGARTHLFNDGDSDVYACCL